MKLWTQAETETAHRLRAQGLTSAEIGERLGRTYDAVAKRLRQTSDTPVAPPWTDEQLAYLAEHIEDANDVLVKALSEIGPTRTPKAVQSKKRDIRKGLKRKPRSNDRPTETQSWAIFRGTPEQRDAEFAIRVIEAKHFCGLIQNRRLVELMIDDVRNGLRKRKEAA